MPVCLLAATAGMALSKKSATSKKPSTVALEKNLEHPGPLRVVLKRCLLLPLN
jgi:hypothetical protein